MKAVSVKILKQELKTRTPDELLEICLRLAKFKKENKELLSYLLFDSHQEFQYIEKVKKEVDLQFDSINRNNYYYIRKSVRKILSLIKKHIRYSQKKETEVELLLFFCDRLKSFEPSIFKNQSLKNTFQRQMDYIEKKLPTLHEDLQYDYSIELDQLKNH